MAGTVSVFVKHPAGLRLRLHEKQTTQEVGPGGMARSVDVMVPVGDGVVLHGTAAPFGQARKDAAGNFVPMVAGYAVTHGVSKDFWDKWLAQNGNHDMVRNHLIYAHEKPGEGEAWARDHAAVRTGLEPLTPNITDGGGRLVQSDPRAPRGVALADRAAA